MNFEESVNYLYNLGYELSVKKFGLENTVKLLDKLGNPQNNFTKIQVAGTNGKGSTCAFLEAICVSAGIKTGLYTSPHLISVTERIKINGAEISEEDFAKHATKIKKVSEKLFESGELETVPTFFEQVTAIALSVFVEERIEIAILETGIGGRFDATTATNAEIVAITPIDFDHQDILGNTLAKIAAEKAAIIRSDTKVILAPQKKEAERVVLGKCREKGVEPIFATADFQVKKDFLTFPMLFVTYKTLNNNYPNVLVSLAGRHQFENAAIAINIAETLREFKFEISQNSIIAGLETAEHKGRLEFYKGILFDGAHNVAGAKALREYLDEFVKRPITMIFGSMKDKDLSEITGILFPLADKLILTSPDNPRSMKTADLMKFLPENFDKLKIYPTEDIEQALKIAKNISCENDLICVTGSLYLVGEAQKLLNNKS
ncbi:MAG: bifunctional folylpolyglutamate synthase/dihydrofolate synthase [Pyrinomonadaceae bacterium]